MRRRWRVLVVLASTFAMVLALGAGTAFAHDVAMDETEFPGAVNGKGHAGCASDLDPLFCNGVFDRMDAKGNDKALNGIIQGFVNHSPMCTEHYYEDLGGQDHGNPPQLP